MPPMSRRADERMGGRESSEDYLEAILVIRRLRGSCRNVDIAERMGVAKPSVTKALGNLARRGLAGNGAGAPAGHLPGLYLPSRSFRAVSAISPSACLSSSLGGFSAFDS